MRAKRKRGTEGIAKGETAHGRSQNVTGPTQRLVSGIYRIAVATCWKTSTSNRCSSHLVSPLLRLCLARGMRPILVSLSASPKRGWETPAFSEDLSMLNLGAASDLLNARLFSAWHERQTWSRNQRARGVGAHRSCRKPAPTDDSPI